MSLVIVTKRSFLICEDVVSVTLQERIESECDDESLLKVKMHNIIDRISNRFEKLFYIDIKYVPLNLTNKASATCCSLNNMQIRVHGYKEAFSLYTEIVREVREQKPDHRYLDKLVENMLGGIDMEGTPR